MEWMLKRVSSKKDGMHLWEAYVVVDEKEKNEKCEEFETRQKLDRRDEKKSKFRQRNRVADL